jgi:hypothetical protein
MFCAGNTDADPFAPVFASDNRSSDWVVVPGHWQRVQQGLQQRRMPFLRHAVSYVHRLDADRHDV